ncbi:MAG: hypothetical protein PVJ39_13440 [Gammaproteobacteria bacterium]|jgi:hypothetical protein
MAIHFDDDSYYEFLESGDGQFLDQKVLVEGDSWAAHPQLFNLAHRLDVEEKGEFAILSLAAPGDTAQEMFRSKSKQFRRTKRIVKSREFGYSFDMILLSAGGNDIIGPEIRTFLLDKEKHPEKYGADLINDVTYDRALKMINKDFSNFLNVVTKSSINKETPVVAHTYSFLKPRRVGTHLGPVVFSEGWVAQYMEDDKHIYDEQEQVAVIKGMLERFRDSLQTLEHSFSNFLAVDTLNTLTKNRQPDVEMFHDEIHPNKNGFQKVLKRIKTQAKRRGYWVS